MHITRKFWFLGLLFRNAPCNGSGTNLPVIIPAIYRYNDIQRIFSQGFYGTVKNAADDTSYHLRQYLVDNMLFQCVFLSPINHKLAEQEFQDEVCQHGSDENDEVIHTVALCHVP